MLVLVLLGFLALLLAAYAFNLLAQAIFYLTPVILVIAAIFTAKSIYLHKTGQAPPPPKQVERPIDFTSKVAVLAFDHDVIEKEEFDENKYSLKLRGRLRNDSEWKVGYVHYECQWKDTWNQRDERFGSSVWVGLEQNQEGEFTENVPIWLLASRGAVMGKQHERGLVYHRCRISKITPVIGG